ncbi:MAG TPA: alpha-ketoglutarate-dependent dioxygenase AlkB [Noviherbaspirillum sp.]|jgi:alkylated DNA repair dioxygenase AlkB|uniref:alpha-ketoglutarate-dependent dioxygenase AlkB family protein n=1 Tax=Noviherbaspirillum sp. TaxID=1926288 RepID=UPI002F91C6A2
MTDLFDDAATLQAVPMPDADVRFARGFYRPPTSTALLRTLLDETAWRQERIIVWNQERLQPRLSAWYGDAGSRYTYSGRAFHPLAWTPTLLRMKAEVETATGERYNSVLLNLYRDGEDSVSWHSDGEPELGPAPAIASVSLGETRVFRFRHRQDKALRPVSIALEDGSLLLMRGSTQRCWQHAIMKEKRVCGPRINLTFRQIRQG